MTDDKNLAGKGIGCLFALLQLLITQPIWYYLLYRVLVAVQADTPMWIAYWVYVPAGFILGAIRTLTDEMAKP